MATPKLFELPPEVRNLIYIAYLQLHGDAVYVSTAKRLVTRGPLRKTNQQIRNESESLVDLHARNINFPVYDFQFRYLITFLNKLDKLALDALAKQSADASSTSTVKYSKAKRFTIQLLFDESDIVAMREGLGRWLRRFDSPEKKGTAVDFAFEVTGDFFSVDTAEEMVGCIVQKRYLGDCTWREGSGACTYDVGSDDGG